MFFTDPFNTKSGQMKNAIRLCGITILLLFVPGSASSQHLFRLGPSVSMTFESWSGTAFLSPGIGAGFETALGSRYSLSLTAAIQYGYQRSWMNPFELKGNFLAGLRPEFRVHFTERYNGYYLGLGGDITYISTIYRYAYFPDYYKVYVRGIDLNIGGSFGKYIPIGNGKYINPELYIGFNPVADWNEYPANFRFAVNYSF